MQCKDIPDLPVLRLLVERPWDDVRPATWYDLSGHTDPNWPDNSVQQAMPPGVPEKLARAKMAMLIRRGLVSGCCCGCRGDFEITDAGRAFIEQATPCPGSN